MSVEQLVIEFASRKLRQLEERIETCVGKLADDQLWSRAGENSNAAGNLCLHLAGTVRDAEFAARGGIPREELLARLRQTVDDACRVLDTLPSARLLDTITPQNYQVSVTEAMLHVVEHFAEHTGQIILLTKALTGEDLGFYAHLRGPAAPPPPPAGQQLP
jgi:hypothetical protein